MLTGEEMSFNKKKIDKETKEIVEGIEKDLGKEISFDKVSLEVKYPSLEFIDPSELKKFLLKFVEGIDSPYYEKDELVWNEEGYIELWRDGEVDYAWSPDNIFRKFVMDYLGIEEDDKKNE